MDCFRGIVFHFVVVDIRIGEIEMRKFKVQWTRMRREIMT